MNKSKCIEYYLDSRTYNQEELQKNIQETKKEFPKQEITVNVQMNKFGMYIITFYFENKNTIFNKMRIYFNKKNKRKLLLEENIKQSHKYGQYKSTGTYKPY